MRVLITGASGPVGSALLRSVPPQTELRALSRPQLDICDARAVRSVVAAFQPALIINAAAYTAVDKAESEPGLAAAINTQAPRHLAEAAKALEDCRLIQLSTDYCSMDAPQRRINLAMRPIRSVSMGARSSPGNKPCSRCWPRGQSYCAPPGYTPPRAEISC